MVRGFVLGRRRWVEGKVMDYETVRQEAKCATPGCPNGAMSMYSKQDKAANKIVYTAFCGVKTECHAPEEWSWVGWTRLR